MIGEPQPETDRATSIAITHVLTIGITTILIALLLTSAGGLLESETDRSAETSLETVGERLAGEINSVDRLSADGSGSVNITTDHPRSVANSGYRVELLNRTTCAEEPLLEGSNDCIRLTSSGADADVYVPVATDTPLEDGRSADGGPLEIYVDGNEITIRRAD